MKSKEIREQNREEESEQSFERRRDAMECNAHGVRISVAILNGTLLFILSLSIVTTALVTIESVFFFLQG